MHGPEFIVKGKMLRMYSYFAYLMNVMHTGEKRSRNMLKVSAVTVLIFSIIVTMIMHRGGKVKGKEEVINKKVENSPVWLG